MKRIIIAVSASVSAYKSPSIIRALMNLGYIVDSMQTPNSENFITKYTLEAVSNRYWINEWGKPNHIAATDNLDAFVLVPATANTIAKIANGIADNIVTDSALSLEDKTVRIVCPAMNTRMWNASVTKSNIVKLESRQWIVINPSYGKLACNTTGDGKLASTETIVKFITEILK